MAEGVLKCGVKEEFGARRDEVAEDCVRSSLMICTHQILLGDEMGLACSKHGEKERCICGLVGKPERKRLLWRPKA